MRNSDTLAFDLSSEQEAVLAGSPQASGDAADGELEHSYRAWNAAFVACDEPLEGAYRAWNASFVACDKPLES